MTLHYSIVFGLLILEIALFLFLSLPLPTKWQKALFRRLSTSPMVAHARYSLKIVFGMIFVLFVDSVNRLYAFHETVHAEEESGSPMAVHDVRMETGLAAKRFYAQRNMYLTGSTLFLLLILNRTYNMTLEVIQLEEQVALLSSGSSESVNVPARHPIEEELEVKAMPKKTKKNQ